MKNDESYIHDVGRQRTVKDDEGLKCHDDAMMMDRGYRHPETVAVKNSPEIRKPSDMRLKKS